MNEIALKKITELRRALHKHPELSMHEKNTMETLRRFISGNTSLEIIDRGDWFYAYKQGADASAPSAAFRTDTDALPMREAPGLPYASVNEGAAHKCGHDGHCAAMCAVALMLDAASVKRDVYLIFQHAEETGQGGAVCSNLIREKNIGEVYAFHNLSGYPEGHILLRRGLTQPSSEGLTLKLTGRPSHASAPECGINPAMAISRVALYSQALMNEAHEGAFMCTVVGISAGRGDFGVSPGYGELKITLRAELEHELKAGEEALIQYAREEAEREGLIFESVVSDYFPETKNDPSCADRVARAAKKLGLPVTVMEKMWLASEDFGYYLKECPGAIFYIGNGEDYPPLHTEEYDFNDNLIPLAADIFFELANM
ncbi:MAG: amidohydrolase [Clostridia bacterium]|nr:amidohydrolase [Clostridia bacterium]